MLVEHTFGDRKLSVPDTFEDPGLPHRHIFSPSQYSMYKRCPKQYYFRYVCGMKSKPGVALIQGSSVHKGAEVTHQRTIDTGTPLDLKDAKDAVADTFENRRLEIEDWEDKDPGMIKDQTLGHFEIYYQTAVPLINPVKVEASFAIKFGTVPVLGFIDLVDKVKDLEGVTEPLFENVPVPEVEVVSDLKFTGKQWSSQQLRHDPQLTFYAHAEGTPRVRIDFLLDLKSGTRYVAKRSTRTPRDVKQLTEDLEETVDYIKRGVFPRVLPSEWKCTPKWCGYYEKCRGPK